MWQLQSPAPWPGLSILSPTSWLFKRAKAQQCSFLNTQIHVHRDHCLVKEPPPPRNPPSASASSPSSSLFLLLSPHLGLSLSTAHYPPSSKGLITSRLVLLLPPTPPSPSHIFHRSSHTPLHSFTTIYLSPCPPNDLRNPFFLPSAPSQHSSFPFSLLLLWHGLIDGTRGRPLDHPSLHAWLDLAVMSEEIELRPNSWRSSGSLHRELLVDNMCQHHICGKVAQGAWIDVPECSLWLCRDRPAGHPQCGCGAHYTSQPQSSSRPQCGDKNREGCSDYP